MKRITIALLAALEAVIAVAIGVGIALVPLTILWATQSGLSTDWTVFWRAAVDTWLLGHGVAVTIQLPPEFVAMLGLPGAEAPFTLSLALLGFAVLTIVSGLGAGRRAAHSEQPLMAGIIVMAVFWVLAALIGASAGHELAMPAQPQAVILPGLIYAASVVVSLLVAGQNVFGSLGRTIRDGLVRWVNDFPPAVPATIAAALRGGTIAAAAVMAVAGVLVTISLLVHYATVISLYESLQAGALGGVTLTIAQLALLPNAVVWAASWIVGPGFAVGVGTTVSPGVTVLGPVPGLPLFAALPDGGSGLGFVVLLVPILAGFAVGVLLRQRMPQAAPSATQLLAHGALTGVCAGVVLGLLAWFSGGAAGPGRFQELGPNPWLVAGFAALEVGIPAIIGLFVGAKRGNVGASNASTATANRG